MFVVQKVLLALVLPPASLIVLIVGGLVLARWRKTAGRALLAAGIALLYALSLDPVADRLIRPLEAFSRPFSAGNAKADAVVVLGGGVYDLGWVPAPAEPSGSSMRRLVAGIGLAKKLKLPLVLSGGSGGIHPGAPPEADAMASVAEGLGFPRKDIIVENRSRNTWENAGAVRETIQGRTVVLVTSAFHMRRSFGMFRRQGFTVLPAPASYHAQVVPLTASLLLPKADALAVSSTALSEYLSLAWHGSTGHLQ